MDRSDASGPLPVTLGIATTGRRGIVGQTLAFLGAQQNCPDRVIISIVHPDDLDTGLLPALPFPVTVLTGPKGSCAQRNAIIEAAARDDVVLFIDDDFLMSDGYISALRQMFLARTDVVMATGLVLADGIHSAGFTHDEGRAILAQAPRAGAAPEVRETYSVYGCNMAVRMSSLIRHRERFDEALPLYGWLEDMDLSRRMARHGRIVKGDGMTGVHLGTRIGRSPGLNLGYSQIANPVHLIRKGSVRATAVIGLMARNILANAGRALWPEPWIDRRGRLQGNAMALLDLVRGRCRPGRVLELAARPRKEAATIPHAGNH